MKIILKKEVTKLGFPGDVKTVKDGYGRNFLIPKGHAMLANKRNMAYQEKLRTEFVKVLDQRKVENQTLKESIENRTLTIEVKAGANDKLFGSVTAADIAGLLSNEGITVDRKKIQIAEAIRSIGSHKVTVNLGQEVIAHITLTVLKEGGDETEKSGDSREALSAPETQSETESAPKGEASLSEDMADERADDTEEQKDAE